MMHRRIRRKKISHNPNDPYEFTVTPPPTDEVLAASGTNTGKSGKFWDNFTAGNITDLLSDLFGVGSSYYDAKTAQLNNELAGKLNQGGGGDGDKTNYKPWIIAGASLLVIVLVIVLLTRKK